MDNKIIWNESVTAAVAEIQESDSFENLIAGLDALNDFVFDNSSDDKSTVGCLFAIHNLRKLLVQIHGPGR